MVSRGRVSRPQGLGSTLAQVGSSVTAAQQSRRSLTSPAPLQFEALADMLYRLRAQGSGDVICDERFKLLCKLLPQQRSHQAANFFYSGSMFSMDYQRKESRSVENVSVF